MNLHDALKLYLEFKTPNTKRSYLTIWGQWEKYCKSLDSPTFQEAHEFIASLRILGRSDATVRHRYQALLAIHGFLVSLGVITHNPFVPLAKTISWRQFHQVRPTKLIDRESISRILNSPEWTCSYRDTRDRAILALLFGTGMRRSEVRALNVGDVCLTADGIPYLTINNPKSGKVQHQPIPGWAWLLFSSLVSIRNSHGCKNEDPLLIEMSRNGYPRMSESSLYRVFKRRFGCGCHAARATFATQLKDQGFRDEEVAVALRHSGNTQVRRYDKNREAIVRNVSTKVRY